MTERLPLEPVDPEEVATALRAVRDRAPPEDPTSLGCAVAIVAIIALVMMPFAARFTPLSAGALLGIGAALALLAGVGGFFGIFGGGFPRGAVITDVENAIEELVDGYPEADRERLLSAAVRILDQSVVSSGPASVSTFDSDEVAERLGAALPFVVEVERVLAERGEIYRCFTLDE